MRVANPDPREAKLPRWAQELLESERRARHNAERLLSEHTAEVPESNVWRTVFMEPVYLPADSRVHFAVDNDHDNVIEVAHVPGGIQLRGRRSLALLPEVSNTVTVVPAGR